MSKPPSSIHYFRVSERCTLYGSRFTAQVKRDLDERVQEPQRALRALTDPEVYALAAWLLYRNNIIGMDREMNAKTLPQVRKPNRDGFLPDPRPDVR